MRIVAYVLACLALAGILALALGQGGSAMAHVPGQDRPSVCTTERTGMFNPCATLDTTQVQDRRAGVCEWTGAGWAMVPCHYSDADNNITITQQPQEQAS